jgi:hypothetical protein
VFCKFAQYKSGVGAPPLVFLLLKQIIEMSTVLTLKRFTRIARSVADQYEEYMDKAEAATLYEIIQPLLKANLHHEPLDNDPEDSKRERVEHLLHCFFDPSAGLDGFAELQKIAQLPQYAQYAR